MDTDRAQLNPPDEVLLDSKHKLVFLSDTARIKPTRQASLQRFHEEVLHTVSTDNCSS